MSSSKSEHKRGFSLPRIDVLPYTMVISSLMPFLTTFCPSPMSTLTIIISITSQSLAHTRNTMITLNGWMNEWEPFLSASPLAWSPTHTFYHLINLYGCCHWEHGGGHMPTHPCREAMPDQSHAVPDGWKLGFLAQEPRSCARASLSGGALLSIRVVHYVHVRHQKKSLLGSAPAESNCLDQGLSGPITQ